MDETSGGILARRVQDNTPVALLCHAPAAVLAAENETGGSPFAGRKMTGFSNDEERASGLAEKAKWLLEDKLVELGVDYEKAQEPYSPHVTVDGALYSGQNPSSSQQLAERLVADLSR